MVNDLERAARSLLPAIDEALADARDGCGSGRGARERLRPTVVGVFPGPERRGSRAGGRRGARRALPGRERRRPVDAPAAAPRPAAA